MMKYRKLITMSALVVLVGVVNISQATPVEPVVEQPQPVVKPVPKPKPIEAPAPVLATEPVPEPVVTPAPKPVAPPQATYSSVWGSSDVIYAVNVIRGQGGLPPLTENGLLNSSAHAKAVHLCQNNYWAHYAPDGTSPYYFIQNAGYLYLEAGENLAYDWSNVTNTVNGWVASPTHYANMMKTTYNDIGSASVMCSSYQGKPNMIITVNHFGRR